MATSASALKTFVEASTSDAMVAEVERRLGFTLPRASVDLARGQNGGALLRTAHRTKTATSWAPDHIAISAIVAIGFEKLFGL